MHMEPNHAAKFQVKKKIKNSHDRNKSENLRNSSLKDVLILSFT